MFKDVFLILKDGELFLVLGFLGCGKIILLNIIVGFLVFIDGKVVFNDDVVIGLVFECGMVF